MKKKQLLSKNIIVFYHNGCPDGFGGAWVAWQKFKQKAEYIPVEHGKEPIVGLADKEIYLIDFCYSADAMRELLARNKKVVVLDHHVSQRDAVSISTDHIYDVARSGSAIAWRYFFPGKPLPRLLKHIQDIDLWQFKVAYTKELIAALDQYPFEFRLWNNLARDWEDAKAIKLYIDAGRSILKYEQRVVDRLVCHAEHVLFEGYDAYAVNSPILESEIGNWIVQHKQAIGIIWSQKGSVVRVSLRSDRKVDVSALAQRYGGGGHVAAAGFGFDSQCAFPWVKKTGKTKT